MALAGWNVKGACCVMQVKRAIQLRNIVTSLGPAYIKLGQALSIRPDILSPAAMNELQKLCDKVPSYNNDDAMQVICDELGAPWYEVRIRQAYYNPSNRQIDCAARDQYNIAQNITSKRKCMARELWHVCIFS